MDVYAMLAGAALFVSGGGFGTFLTLFLQRQFGSESGAICECGHSLAHHSPENKKCTVSMPFDRYDSVGRKTGKEWCNCACKQYVGPPPPSEYFTLGIKD